MKTLMMGPQTAAVHTPADMGGRGTGFPKVMAPETDGARDPDRLAGAVDKTDDTNASAV